MKQLLSILVVAVLLASCQQQEDTKTQWVLEKTIKVDGVNPIGLALRNGELWLSDGDHNRLVKINDQGEILSSIDSLDRPMHIDAHNDLLFVPQYGKDTVETFYANGERKAIAVKDSLDAPAGVSAKGKEIAIADFYNNRILYSDGETWLSFGKEGKAQGEFYYPTDVQLTESEIWVADAYNNRIQVFDKKGNFLRMMGEDQKMNAATGIFVSGAEVFITDFENDRVLVFDLQGNLRQVLNDGIEKPTDILIKEGKLLIINYRSGEIHQFNEEIVKETKET